MSAPTSTTSTNPTDQRLKRPNIERGEEYLYMIHSRDLAWNAGSGQWSVDDLAELDLICRRCLLAPHA